MVARGAITELAGLRELGQRFELPLVDFRDRLVDLLRPSGPTSRSVGSVVSRGIRLSEVRFSEFRKPQVARSIRVAGSIPSLTHPEPFRWFSVLSLSILSLVYQLARIRAAPAMEKRSSLESSRTNKLLINVCAEAPAKHRQSVSF